MTSFPFINNTNKTKFEGTFILDSQVYEYTFYLLPIISELPTEEQEELISYFGNRMFKGETCLDVDEATVSYYLYENVVSAFVIVKPKDVDNIASGTLQIYNWCYLPSDDINEQVNRADVFINDVCRLSPTKINTGNPLKAMFFLMEQLTIQNMEKNKIKLFVENTDEKKNILKPKYISLGFTLNTDDDVSANICPQKDKDEFVMEKSNLESRPDIIDLSFLKIAPYNLRSSKKQRIYGGKRKRNITNKNKQKNKGNKKKRTYKNNRKMHRKINKT
jgi:hypothetical protein